MRSSEQLLEQAAQDGSFEPEHWPVVLQDILQRLDAIVNHEFPRPTVPPPPFRNSSLNPSQLTTQHHSKPSETSSQESQVTDKENAPPTHSTPERPPVPPFDSTATPTTHHTSTDDPYTLPPELSALVQSIKSTLLKTFPIHPPHTVQRLAELILHPKSHYRFLPPYLRALDRVVNVTSNTTIYPLSSGSSIHAALVNGGTAIPSPYTTDMAITAAEQLGIDESLGGALLTPIPWLQTEVETSAETDADVGRNRAGGEMELQSESTEMVEGPNGMGMGKVETVSVVNGVLASSTDGRPQRGGEQRLRAEPTVTQVELLRMQHETAQVPGDDEEERPHVWGPDEITVEDTGAILRNPGAGLDIDTAVGRTGRAESTGMQDEKEEVGSPEVEMKDSGGDEDGGEDHTRGEGGSEDKRLDQEDEEMADE